MRKLYGKIFVNASDETRNGDSEYKFTCYVAAPEMANTITAELYDSSGNPLQTQTYSVQQYITEFDAIHDFSDTDLQTVKESVSGYAITKDFDLLGNSL